MSNINNQPLANPLSLSDQLAVWSSDNGDTRRTSLTALLALFAANSAVAVTPTPPIFLPFIAGTGDVITGAAAVGVSITALNTGDTYSFFPILPNTGPVTLNVAGLGAKNVYSNGVALVSGQLAAGVPLEVIYDGVKWNILLSLPVPSAITVPTRQVFNVVGAAVWTRPVGCRLAIATVVGGGGGGSGSGSTGPNNGTVGSASTFNSIGAAGGSPGINTSNDPTGGVGGTGGAGVASRRIAGAPGSSPACIPVSGTNSRMFGGAGGGAGGGKYAVTGVSATVANMGGGGAGGGYGTDTFANIAAGYMGAGGGEGETAQVIIATPAASYAVAVGDGGAGGGAGTSGFAGGKGGSGIVIVDEYY